MPLNQKLDVVFFKTLSNSEPVKEWLKEFSTIDKKIIGSDIRTVQIGWPLGMPLVRKIAPSLWEIRSIIPDGIVRVFLLSVDVRYFYCMVLPKKLIKPLKKN